MPETIFTIIEGLPLLIGSIGIAIIVIGSAKGLYHYVKSSDEHNFQHVRLVLSSHIILGLDFMVGQDIINTVLLNEGAEFWQELAGLITVVAIRIILTHFMLKEIKQAEAEEIRTKTA